MEKLIKGTHHISLKANGKEKFDELVHFYHDILGLPFIRRWGEGDKSSAMLDTGNSIMELGASGDDNCQSGSIRHFALATNQVDRCVEVVRAAGYKITVEPKDVVIASEPPLPIRIAFCIGPCGEEIEFFWEK